VATGGVGQDLSDLIDVNIRYPITKYKPNQYQLDKTKKA
jgi:hypothetical protein